MQLFITALWLLKSVFFCGHLRTPVNEGKCYCPDCGKGLIYQWVVVRCQACQLRIDSKTFLRQVLPARRCCLYCGTSSFRFDYLVSPSYFQLHKAQLIVREEQDYIQGRFHWSLYTFRETVERTVGQTLLARMEPSHAVSRTLALLPVRNP